MAERNGAAIGVESGRRSQQGPVRAARGLALDWRNGSSDVRSRENRKGRSPIRSQVLSVAGAKGRCTSIRGSTAGVAPLPGCGPMGVRPVFPCARFAGDDQAAGAVIAPDALPAVTNEPDNSRNTCNPRPWDACDGGVRVLASCFESVVDPERGSLVGIEPTIQIQPWAPDRKPGRSSQCASAARGWSGARRALAPSAHAILISREIGRNSVRRRFRRFRAWNSIAVLGLHHGLTKRQPITWCRKSQAAREQAGCRPWA